MSVEIKGKRAAINAHIRAYIFQKLQRCPTVCLCCLNGLCEPLIVHSPCSGGDGCHISLCITNSPVGAGAGGIVKAADIAPLVDLSAFLGAVAHGIFGSHIHRTGGGVDERIIRAAVADRGSWSLLAGAGGQASALGGTDRAIVIDGVLRAFGFAGAGDLCRRQSAKSLCRRRVFGQIQQSQFIRGQLGLRHVDGVQMSGHRVGVLRSHFVR